ncbi:AAA family ATPase [Halanaerobaculum tunisiense]
MTDPIDLDTKLLNIAIEEWLTAQQRLTPVAQQEYLNYRTEVFDNFIALFEITIPDDIKEDYEEYICNWLQNYFTAEGYLEEVELVDIEEFIFYLAEDKKLKFKIYLRYFLHLAQRLHHYQHNKADFVLAIQDLNNEVLLQAINKYRGQEKIKQIRYQIARAVLNNDFSVAKLEKIKQEVSQQYEKKILQAWSDFSILFQLYYDQYQEKIQKLLQEIYTILAEELKQRGHNLQFQSKLADFAWNNTFGTDSCWLALYPVDKSSHQKAAQLFLKVTRGSLIEYGLALGDRLEQTGNSDLEIITSLANLKLETIINKFSSVISDYRRINGESSALTVDFSQELSINQLYFPPKEKGRIKRQVRAALKNNKHIILVGPPGVGKSKLAEEICASYQVTSQLVTANPDWSTFDTIGGYQPTREGELSFKPGVVLNCLKADSQTIKNQWLIVDEINRVDIDQAFGALFSVLTGDTVTLSFQANNGENIQLGPQRGAKLEKLAEHEYVVPDSWRLIATMNTFDKTSLYEMSYAFMRRFAFISLSVPEEITTQVVTNYLECWRLEDTAYLEQVTQLWQVVRSYRELGPAVIKDLYHYLLTTKGDYASAVTMYILPQLEGLLAKELTSLLAEIINLDFIVNQTQIKQFTRDYFNLEVVNNED